jgi:hypothetical protein
MSPLNAAICTTTYLEKQKFYCPGKKILFKKQLFDLGVNGPVHNIFIFRDMSMIFGVCVHDHKAVCRVYRIDLRGTLTMVFM